MKIILGDDSSMHRWTLVSMLKESFRELGQPLEILGEADNGAKLFELREKVGNVDIVFSDIRMPEMDGLSGLVKIKHRFPSQKVVMVSSEDLATMERAHSKNGSDAQNEELAKKITMIDGVAQRIKAGTPVPGKVNLILDGCEKLVVNPIDIAKHFGASGYLRKPYDPVKVKTMIKHLSTSSSFLALV